MSCTGFRFQDRGADTRCYRPVTLSFKLSLDKTNTNNKQKQNHDPDTPGCSPELKYRLLSASLTSPPLWNFFLLTWVISGCTSNGLNQQKLIVITGRDVFPHIKMVFSPWATMNVAWKEYGPNNFLPETAAVKTRQKVGRCNFTSVWGCKWFRNFQPPFTLISSQMEAIKSCWKETASGM